MYHAMIHMENSLLVKWSALHSEQTQQNHALYDSYLHLII